MLWYQYLVWQVERTFLLDQAESLLQSVEHRGLSKKNGEKLALKWISGSVVDFDRLSSLTGSHAILSSLPWEFMEMRRR